MRTVFILLCCCFSFRGFSQVYTAEDKEIFDRYVETMRNKRAQPVPELLIGTARFFLGIPYVAGTLEKEPEQLIVNFRELDCTTFVETCLALTRTLREKEIPTFEDYCRILGKIRYRNGKINNYASRLHYMSDWIVENERQGTVTDITRATGGIPRPLKLSFISSHPDAYKQLRTDSTLLPLIRETEQKLNARTHYYIPKGKIDSVKEKIQNGDLSFIHASLSDRKVIVNPVPLTEYIGRIKHNTGILVVRVN